MDLPIENQRIRELIIYYSNGNELAFSKEIGVSQPRINRLFSPDNRSNKYPLVSFEIIQAVINKFVNVSAEWLISGRGQMFIKDIDVITENAVNEQATRVYKLKSDRNYSNQSVPLYNIEASAGIVTLFRDYKNIEPVDHISIPNLPKCDGAIYVNGDSMYPLLKSGDIVMYRQHDISDGILWGEMYLVSYEHGGDDITAVKYIKKSEEGAEYIKLVSQNQHHQDRDILLKKVRALALVKASIRINSMT